MGDDIIDMVTLHIDMAYRVNLLAALLASGRIEQLVLSREPPT
jgi:hypothetical protein